MVRQMAAYTSFSQWWAARTFSQMARHMPARRKRYRTRTLRKSTGEAMRDSGFRCNFLDWEFWMAFKIVKSWRGMTQQHRRGRIWESRECRIAAETTER